MKIPHVLKMVFMFSCFMTAEVLKANTTRLQFLSLEEGAIEGLYWRHEGQMLPLRVPATFILPPIVISQNEPFIFYRRNEQAAEDEEPWVEVHRLTFEPRVLDAVALLQANGERITSALVPIENRSFPPGSYMMFNRTPNAILIAINEEVSRIPPKRAVVIRPDLDQHRPMPVYYRTEQDDENQSLRTSTWFHDPANREFVFLSSPGDGLEVRVRSVSRRPQAGE